ncbi:CRISPR-associated protein Csx3 [Spirulina subsalsa FACHB-351]|uniref:CRISPR-associated protein Csx3 n=1 Tax=Spirulina subsalsa FACHB-351 TaxID=234711 RepID=A0ABT3L541_9CYAN|nr:CRISPR-associated ring nuclease Crn3/Csx3 [Spirulina subsalsa]MCW6036613.1 CRISPR-associated protein Csx3 [Spirulina subsalsa FACHB-351]
MSAIQLQLIPHKTQCGHPYQHLHIHITNPNGIIIPSDIQGLELPRKIDYSQGIVIEGKGPIWLYGYLVHECHPAAWVGCYDTRLGAIVVATHTPDINISQIFKIDLPDATFQK